MSPRSITEEELERREQIMLDAALAIMERESVTGLTIDKLAAAVPYSKGTVYNHFSCKEDIIAGVCNLSMARLGELFARALTLEGSGRERMLAQHYAYLLYARLHPTRFLLVVSAKAASVMERTSERRLAEHRALDERLFGRVLTAVNQAVEEGDLVLPAHLTPQQVAFANWATAFGTISLLQSHFGDATCRDGLQIERELFNNINILLDGLGWRPLSSECDYQETLRRIEREVFADELASLPKPTISHRKPS